MLVLTRKKNESIILSGGVTITVVDLTGGRVRIGIDAPPEVECVRAELLRRDGRPFRQPAEAAA